MKKAILLLVAVVGIAIAIPAKGQTNAGSLSQAYALFMANFIKYVDNPVKQGEYKVVIIGNSQLAKEMNRLNGTKTVSGQTIRIIETNDVNEAADSRVVFIDKYKHSKLEEVVALSQNTLIVTERSGAVEKGSCINFYMEGDKVRFEVGTSSYNKQGLRISSGLLSHAKVIE